ncbi:MAG: hypothetical protein JST30_10225 [Armatimonadetes bacterium]|nr:hypothetical protein [Armatimonadota bacterium]
MPARRKKARKVRLEPGPWLWAAFAVNIVLGLALSPLTAVQKVRAVGVADYDRERTTEVLQTLRGVPVARVDGTLLRSRLSADRGVLACSFTPNMFGRAVVRVTTRTPVAVLEGGGSCLDGGGVLFPCSVSKGLPELKLPDGYGGIRPALSGSWESTAVAEVCRDLPAQIPNVDWKVELGTRGVLSLQASGTEIVLGSSEHLPRKIGKLKELLDERPGLLGTAKQVNLTAPDAPMILGR